MEDKNTNTRKLTGIVTKLSGDKTIKVRVERKYRHPKYGKIVKEHKNYLVHCEDVDSVVVGDVVEIEEVRPISKLKSWSLVKILN